MTNAIIPIFNSDKTFKRSTITTQIQNIGNLEIIFVNDFSYGNIFSVIEDLMEDDNRIQIHVLS